jgi:lambda family phage portal protein
MLSDDGATRPRTTLVDRLVGYFSPVQGFKRVMARQALTRAMAYEGASRGGRNRFWNPGSGHANENIRSLPVLRARSRDLVRNNAWATSALEGLVSETIGGGIIPQAVDKADQKMADLADSLWLEWGDEVACHSDGKLDFYGIQALAMKTMAEAGSCLIRRRWRRASDGLPVPMQLQVLEPEFLDTSRDTLSLADRGKGFVVGGIEFDAVGKLMGYWLFPEHPSNRPHVRQESRFVPAADVIHLYRVDRAGQVDGVPWGAPVLLRLRNLDLFEEAELVKQQIAACFAAFVHDTEPPENIANLSETEKNKLRKIEPGSIEWLPPGKEITFGSPQASGAYGEHVPWQLRAIAASYGVTYETVTNDYSRSNFSSSRMGRLAMARNVARWQQHLLLPQMLKPVWRWFTDAAIVGGRLPRHVAATWTMPRREMIDPVKETEAIDKQIGMGMMTLSEAIREQGKDPKAVFLERQKELKLLLSLEIPTTTVPQKAEAVPPKALPAAKKDEPADDDDGEEDDEAEDA